MIEKVELSGPSGTHQCIVHEPLLTSLLHFQATLDPKSLPEDLLKGALQQLLLALDYLHTEAHVVHTDIQAKNIIICAKDDSIFCEWDENQATDPIPQKVNGNYTVYLSRPFHRKKGWSGFGMPLFSDFGEARLGKIWDLFEDHHLFDGRGPDGSHSDVQLLAEMKQVLGSPPSDFLRKSPYSLKYWDSSGQWKSSVEVPHNSLEDSEEYLEGEDKKMLMQFVRKMLQWDPEKRQSARELLTDPWLTSE
ncbi:kinase-like protein [Aspergillus ellipticus CBS 707.79]|uniref:non-specific serine/threonine protein kinase n=1 Tax=Aspergillus ellipticus CBS 707.79 TaxID=1448320 RepID=A0A319EMM3_9EURO|nr:kinase-like protein [Aspergillus ellipticus CBS 707.79]